MRERRARVEDVHEIAAAMPHVKRIEGPKGNSIYQVGGKSFVFFPAGQERSDSGSNSARPNRMPRIPTPARNTRTS